MNTRRNGGQSRGGAVAGGNQVTPQAPAEGVSMPVNPTGLTDVEVRTSLTQMAQAITKVQSKTSEDPQEFVGEVHKILVAMGPRDLEKAELASYQLKDVAQTWCKMWQDSQALGEVPANWELFKTTFLERFFPKEMREAKVEVFINLKQASITVCEYSLKFAKLSRLMEYVQQVEDNQNKRGVRDVRRPEPFDQRSVAPREGTPEPKKGNEGDVHRPRKDYAKCGRARSVECRQGLNVCFGCGKNRHMVKDCPQNRGQAGGNAQPRANPQGAAAAEPPKRNRSTL
ncbi:uncharacterized protein [Solanum lycopersicum]|uniref:uncharacterized protein n=1 Tax=Solanum lycopersicum TaxID=4081 RepID=UPI0037484FC4